MPFSLSLDNAKPAVIGLGYVGLPLALALGKRWSTVGFDVNSARIEELGRGHDGTGEVEPDALAQAKLLKFSADLRDLEGCNVFLIAVPTPVNHLKRPDLSPLAAATKMVAKLISKGSVIIFESTVYPGATEETCVPILELVSGLVYNRDFFVGYSPERINPGDKQRRLPDVVKVTSASTEEAAAFVDALYRAIIPAGTHRAPSIRVAEAAKAIENTQRDVNIALVNEFAQMFARMGIDSEAVLRAAGSKWNFLPFWPGLVGGHCIGVDPYYLVHKAQEVGYHPELILAARRINENMSHYVSAEILKLLAQRKINIVGSAILVLGFSFKENCADLRNTRVVEIVHGLRSYHARVDVFDPWADARECENEYGIKLTEAPAAGAYDAVIVAVAHRQFAVMGHDGIRRHLKPGGVIYDIKYVLPKALADGRL